MRAQGRFEEALEALDAGERLLSARPEFSAARAQILNELGRYREALAFSWQALEAEESSETHQAARFAQGFALLMLGQLEEATIALEALLAVNPAYPDAAWLRAGALRQRLDAQHPGVLTAFDFAVQSDPANPYLQVERADVLRACGRYAEAREVYARICADESCADGELRLEATFKLGLVAMVLGETQTAREAFRAVLAVAPETPDAADLLVLLDA